MTTTKKLDLTDLAQCLRAQSTAAFGPEGFALLAEAADALAALAQSEAPATRDMSEQAIISCFTKAGVWLGTDKGEIAKAVRAVRYAFTQQAAPEAPASEQQAAVQIQHDAWGVYHKPTGKWVKDRDGRIELLSKQNAKNICINDEYEARHLRIEIHLAIPAATVDAQADTTTASADHCTACNGSRLGNKSKDCEACDGTGRAWAQTEKAAELAAIEATTASASEPLIYLSEKQLPLLGKTNYIAYRMKSEGNFQLPVYRAPSQQTEPMQPSRSDT